jgi:hypothetical protein
MLLAGYGRGFDTDFRKSPRCAPGATRRKSFRRAMHPGKAVIEFVKLGRAAASISPCPAIFSVLHLRLHFQKLRRDRTSTYRPAALTGAKPHG